MYGRSNRLLFDGDFIRSLLHRFLMQGIDGADGDIGPPGMDGQNVRKRKHAEIIYPISKTAACRNT